MPNFNEEFEPKELDTDDLAKFIQDKLLEEKKVFVAVDDIISVLDYETEYMIDNGFAVSVDEDGNMTPITEEDVDNG